MALADHTLTLTEALDLAEAASEGFVQKPDGTRIALGFDGQGQPKDGGLFDAKGRVPLRIIRPGIGRGKGSHLYESKMLEENAHVFAGWPSYIDHRSEEARKAAAGLPRSLRDKGGIIKETWWDPTVPADEAKNHGAGAVMGMVRPIKAVRELIDDDPALVEASISALATGVTPTVRDGKKVWLVEGIHPKGSVDFVSEAGAGGRVHDIWESIFQTDDDVELALMECMTDGEIRDHLKNDRPELLEALTGVETAKEDDVPITKEQLLEALRENPEILAELVPQPVSLTEALASDDGKAAVQQAAEEFLTGQAASIRASARADAQREVQVERLERSAHKLIREAALPPKLTNHLLESYSIDVEGEPAPGLNIFDDVDPDTGAVTKGAADKLREAIEVEVARHREILAEAVPTVVRGQGPSGRRTPGNEGGTGPVDIKESAWAKYLTDKGINPNDAYGIPLVETPAAS